MKSSWEFIWNNAMNDAIIMPFFGLFLLSNVNNFDRELFRNLWKNPEFVKKYWNDTSLPDFIRL